MILVFVSMLARSKGVLPVQLVKIELYLVKEKNKCYFLGTSHYLQKQLSVSPPKLLAVELGQL